MACQRIERRLNEVLKLIGARFNPLKDDRKSVETLHARMEQLMQTPTEHLAAEDVFKWARLLMRIDAPYLQAIKDVLGENEPWDIPVHFGQHLLTHAPVSTFHVDINLAGAYGYLNYAQEQLVRVAYMTARKLYGPVIANRKFPEVQGDVNEAILALIPVEATAKWYRSDWYKGRATDPEVVAKAMAERKAKKDKKRVPEEPWSTLT